MADEKCPECSICIHFKVCYKVKNMAKFIIDFTHGEPVTGDVDRRFAESLWFALFEWCGEYAAPRLPENFVTPDMDE